MKRCSSGGGPFGLIVHRKGNLRFCSKACKTSYEYEEDKAMRQAKQNWRPPKMVSLRPDAAKARRQVATVANKQPSAENPWLERLGTIYR